MDVRRTGRSRSRCRIRRGITLAGSSLAVIALAVPLVLAATAGSAPRGLRVYVGTASGVSASYTSALGAPWTRAAAGDIPDVGSSAAPALVDLNGNGSRDLLVGNGDGKVLAFANTGTDGAPVWKRTSAWDPAIDVGAAAAPAALDLDGDGLADLVIGSSSGNLVAFKNTGTKKAPVWTRHASWDVAGIGSGTHPAAGDLNGDRRADLVVGTAAGILVAFTTTSDPAHPSARASTWDVKTALGIGVAPAAGDVDGDGRADVLVVDHVAHLVAVLRNTGHGFSRQTGWLGDLDAGSGPGGIAFVVDGSGGGGGSTTSAPTTAPHSTTTVPGATSTSIAPSGPVAHLSVSPGSGHAPLPVTFDASSSTDGRGRALTYTWDFGDGSANGAAATDPGAAVADARSTYDTADARREHGDKVGSIAPYVAAGKEFASLTGVDSPAPFRAHGFTTINKIAYFYLTKLGHDLGDVYTFNAIPGFPTECARLQLGWQYFKDQFREAALGGFPGLPSDPSFGGAIKLQISTQKLADHGCATPDAPPMWTSGAPVGDGSARASHTYSTAGTYLARVTVNDGQASSSATVTVTVGDARVPDTTTTTTTAPGGGGGGGGGGNAGQPLEGFGASTPGGRGGTVIPVSAPTESAVRAAFASANRASGPTIIRFDVAGPIGITQPILVTADFLTVEGNGVTLLGTNADGSVGWETVGAILQFAGHDVIVRDLRVRDGGDNLRAQPSPTFSDGTYNIVFDHVSSTGANDDGISIGYGAHDVTVQYSFLAGNDRSIFIKYGSTTNISIHHSWIMKQWIRGPMASSSAFVDYRNNILQEWQLWGLRYEKDASGNVVNTILDETAYAQQRFGNGQDGINLTTSQPVYISGVEYRDHATRQYSGTSPTELPAAPVTTQSVAAMEPNVRANAGAMPRDDVDQRYIDMDSGWSLGDRSPLRF